LELQPQVEFSFSTRSCATLAGALILALWPCRTYIATNIIVVYIPQLTTPDPRSNDIAHILMCYTPLDQGSVLVHNTKTPANRGVM